MSKVYTIAVLVGSLRKESINRKVANGQLVRGGGRRASQAVEGRVGFLELMHRINATFRVSGMELSDKYCCHLFRTSGDKHSICGSVDRRRAGEVWELCARSQALGLRKSNVGAVEL